MITITVGKKRNVTFTPIDQYGNPNPIDSSGNPLPIEGVPLWTVNATGVLALLPSPDGMNCDVVADAAGLATVTCKAMVDGGAREVQGSEQVEAVLAPSRIASLSLAFGPETDL